MSAIDQLGETWWWQATGFCEGGDELVPADSLDLDEYPIADELKADYADFCALVDREGIDLDDSPWVDETQLAHDFVLTSLGHGTGFWDRGHPLGKRLSELTDNYHGDDWALDVTDSNGTDWMVS